MPSIHADRRVSVSVDVDALPWIPSPLPGVDRRMLERLGGEVALATTIVRYAPGARFSAHGHDRGEEFFVLAGTFSDDEGDYPAGTYVRNPPGSRHAPFSASGCVLFVKLRQMAVSDADRVRVLPGDRSWRQDASPGVERASLHDPARCPVDLLRLAPGSTLPERETPSGEELLVVEGTVEGPGPLQCLRAWAWRRSAEPRQPALRSPDGALLWVKRGHL